MSGGAAGGGRGGRGGASVADVEAVQEPVDEREFERLRQWRWSRAEGLPAFRVASNAVLEHILRARPTNIDELLAVHGIGPAFCEKHGDSLLAELADLWGTPGAAAAAIASVPAPT